MGFRGGGGPRRSGRRNGRLSRLWRSLSHEIWLIEVGTLGGLRRVFMRGSRVVLLAARGFFRDRCMEQSAALTYMAIFSLVPLLAFVVSLAKSVGGYAFLRENTIEPFLDRTFGPIGQAAAAGNQQVVELRGMIENMLHTIEKTPLTGMGVFGLLILLYLIVKTLSSVERALNDIWGVKRPRGIVRKVTDYLAIVVVSPVFLTIGTWLTLEVRGVSARLEPVSPLLAILPLVTVCLGMTFVLYTLPNTTVRLSAALIGGTVSGLLWQGLQLLTVQGQVKLATWNPIYTGFAALPLLMLWIYASWLILLLGAELSCAHQNEPVYASMQQTGTVDQAFREGLAPRLAARVAHAFLRGTEPPTAVRLAAETSVAPRAALEVLDELVRGGILARSEREEEEVYLPAREPDTISLADLLDVVGTDPGARPVPVTGRLDERTDQLLGKLREDLRASLHNRSLGELARLLDPPEDLGRRTSTRLAPR